MSQLHRLPPTAPDGTVYVVIETPAGSTSKLKYDEALEQMTLSRPLPAGLTYPYDFGFVPSTRAADGDPLDVLVMWEGHGYPGLVLACRLIGVLEAEQADEDTRARVRNDRLVSVPVESRTMQLARSVMDLPERTRSELAQFFTASVAFENKELTLLGWAGPETATALLRKAVELARRGDGPR